MDGLRISGQSPFPALQGVEIDAGLGRKLFGGQSALFPLLDSLYPNFTPLLSHTADQYTARCYTSATRSAERIQQGRRPCERRRIPESQEPAHHDAFLRYTRDSKESPNSGVERLARQ